MTYMDEDGFGPPCYIVNMSGVGGAFYAHQSISITQKYFPTRCVAQMSSYQGITMITCQGNGPMNLYFNNVGIPHQAFRRAMYVWTGEALMFCGFVPTEPE